jgi:hypothetical protein
VSMTRKYTTTREKNIFPWKCQQTSAETASGEKIVSQQQTQFLVILLIIGDQKSTKMNEIKKT